MRDFSGTNDIATKYKTKLLSSVCPYVCLDLLNFAPDFDKVLRGWFLRIIYA